MNVSNTIRSQYKVDNRRWIMLSLYSMLTICNSFFWVTFASITDLTQLYIGRNSKINDVNINAVNLLANIFLMLYFPGTLLTNIWRKKYGIKKTLEISGLFTVIGAFFRFIPTIFYNSMDSNWIFNYIFFGQFLAAVTQPFFCNIPPGVSNAWFPDNERDLATAIGNIASTAGNAIGLLLSVHYVHYETLPDGSIQVKGMSALLGIQFVVCLIAQVLFTLYFESAPHHPPSLAARVMMENSNSFSRSHVSIDDKYTSDVLHTTTAATFPLATETSLIKSVSLSPHHNHNHNNYHTLALSTNTHDNNANNNSENKTMFIDNESDNSSILQKNDYLSLLPVDSDQVYPGKESTVIIATSPPSSSSPSSSIHHLKHELHSLLQNTNYIVLSIIFSVSTGYLCAFQILLYQMIQPYGYTNQDAAVLGSALIGLGVVASFLTSVVMTCLKAYNSIFKFFQTCTFLSILLFVYTLQANQFHLLFLSTCVLGFFIFPLGLINMELCAETTFPVAEDVSFGMLAVGGNVVGVLLVFLLQYLYTIPNVLIIVTYLPFLTVNIISSNNNIDNISSSSNQKLLAANNMFTYSDTTFTWSLSPASLVTAGK